MWRGGPYNHSLWRLYRFKDRGMEQAYCEETNRGCVRFLYFHICGDLLFSIVNCTSYTGGQLTAGFWLFFATGAAAVLLALAIRFVPAVRRHIILCQAAFTFLLGCLFSVLIPVQSAAWGLDVEALRPAGFPPVVTDPLVDYSKLVLARQSFLFLTSWVWLMTQFIPLALTGLRASTVAAYSCTFVIFVTLMMFCPLTVLSIINSVLLTFCGTMAFVIVSSVLERSRRRHFLAQARLAQELHASQLADSVLNHTLKNILADVAANLEVFLAGAADHSLLEDCVACLRRGMQSCKDRQVYLKLTAGEYQPTLSPVRLSRLAQQVVVGRPITVQAPRTTVLVDTILLSLVLENAISNAFRHGCPKNPNVHLTITEEPGVVTGKPGYRRLRFAVTNALNPARPHLTPAYVQDLFAGKVTRHPGNNASPLSFGIGLSHCVVAAQRGGIQLDLREEGDRVVFSACLDAPRTPYGSSADAADDDDAPVPPPPLPLGLRFYCIDDSVAAQRLLAFHIQRTWPSAAVRCYGAGEDDVAAFLTTALADADVVIMDQHLEYATSTYLGTDLVRQLLASGYRGLVCIRSANDTAEDRSHYALSGAHCTFGKDILGSKMMEELAIAYTQVFGKALQNCPVALQEIDAGEPGALNAPHNSVPLLSSPRHVLLVQPPAAQNLGTVSLNATFSMPDTVRSNATLRHSSLQASLPGVVPSQTPAYLHMDDSYV